MKKVIACAAAILFVAMIVGAFLFANFFGFIMVDYDESPPALPANLDRPSVLVFSKTAGYVHEESLPAGEKLLSQIAQRNGWSIFQTSNGAVMSAQILKQFDVVVWNNTSGTTLNGDQRRVFRQYVENGGGFVGIHAAGGDPWYSWDWYVDELIGTRFIGHTMAPRLQDADLLVRDRSDPIVAHLPPRWRIPKEEWYGFDANVSTKGYTVLLSLDENTYDPNWSAMEGIHPSTWKGSIGQGRTFFTAIGHQAATYQISEFQMMMENALRWAGRF